MVGIKSVLAISVLALLLFAGSSPAAAASATSAMSAPATDTVYVVQPGDTLSGIAWRVYGNANYWACIWKANTWIVNPNYLLVGWHITLPASCSSGGGGSTVRYHVVQPGETLSGIACFYYVDCNYWRIYNANLDRLSDPNFIVAGMVLRIP